MCHSRSCSYCLSFRNQCSTPFRCTCVNDQAQFLSLPNVSKSAISAAGANSSWRQGDVVQKNGAMTRHCLILLELCKRAVVTFGVSPRCNCLECLKAPNCDWYTTGNSRRWIERSGFWHRGSNHSLPHFHSFHPLTHSSVTKSDKAVR